MSDVEFDDDDSSWDLSNVDQNISQVLEDEPNQQYKDVLLRRFGHQQFRPMQWRIISSIIEKKQDVCAIMATGYGKSLCYQFPAVFSNGITFVISPLISLMEDQVLALNMANVPACLMGSAQTKKSIINNILAGEYTIIYATPEYILSEYGLQIIENMYKLQKIVLLAIDEAHCVSKWGHDFRPKYRNLGTLRDHLPNVPILAVTATATPRVQDDICKCLKLKNPKKLCSGFDRPNLYFEVQSRVATNKPFDVMKVYLTRKNDHGYEFSGSTIIYCITKRIVEEVSDNLRVNGIENVMYHSGLSIKQRSTSHEQFVKDKVKVIVATIAFGMGIDKPDVRNVIHYGSSKDIESYYQEVGRAGRDGLPAKCTVFYNRSDFTIHQNLRENSHLLSNYAKSHQEECSLLMETFLNTSECRRKFILNYFNDNAVNSLTPNVNCCDNCKKKLNSPLIPTCFEGVNENGLYNYTEDGVLFLQAVDSLNGKFGMQMYLFFLRGSNNSRLYAQHKKLPLYGRGKHRSEDWWKVIGRILLTEQYLKKNYQKNQNYTYSTVALGTKGAAILTKIKRNLTIMLEIEPPQDLKKLLKVKMPVVEIVSDERNDQKNNQNKPGTSKWINRNAAFAADEINNVKTTTTTTVTVDDCDPTKRTLKTELYAQLLTVRNTIASDLDTMPYLIASNTALMQMAEIKPVTKAQLLTGMFDGLNEGKIQRYGDEFLKRIKSFLTEKNLTLDVPTSSSDSSINKQCSSSRWLSKNDDKKRPVDLQQFSFTKTNVNHQVAGPKDSMEFDPDETLIITNRNIKLEEDEEEEQETKETKPEEQISLDWLDSPNEDEDNDDDDDEKKVKIEQRQQTSQNDSLDDNMFDELLVAAVDNVESKINSEEEKTKRQNTDTEYEYDLCQKKRKIQFKELLLF